MPIPASRPRPVRSGLILAALAALATTAANAADSDSDAAPATGPQQTADGRPWVIARRSICEGRATYRYWQVDYWLRNDGPTPATLRPDQLSARGRGLGFQLARAGSCVAEAGEDVRIGLDRPVGDVRRDPLGRRIAPVPRARGAPGLARRQGGEPSRPHRQGLRPARLADRSARLDRSRRARPCGSGSAWSTVIFLYGPHDPLLGPRALDLALGSARLKDTLPLDRETRLPRCAATLWPVPGDPPADRLDSRVFVSAPNSLHLEAHVPGNQSYRFKDCPVKYGTRMRLRYWYLIAPGTEGETKARIVQYKDAPTAWKILNDGDIDQPLTTVGRWVKVERVFRTEAEATSLTLEFRVSGDVGEVWIDDVSLEPVEDEAGGP